jgi:ribosome biogenesis GTPase
LKKKLSSSPVAVGDNVEVIINKEKSAIIERVLPRQQILARPDPLSAGKEQLIAVNLDQLVIVTSAQNPSFKAGLIDRFLVSAERENLKSVVVINKIDLAGKSEFIGFADAWRKLGYRVIFTSAKKKTGLSDLVEILKDKESALAGHSGVGKSSLINAIQPNLDIKTRQISQASGRGVHTTTSVMMYPLDFGGWVVDTPGLKVFGLTGIDRKNLASYFPEINELSSDCRFSDCQHINEPDCAVKRAVDNKKIFSARYESYKRLWQQLETT